MKPNEMLFTAAEHLIDGARQIHEARIIEMTDKGMRSHMNTIEFWELHATLRLDLGRQFGKTTYIAKRAQPGDIVLVENAHQVKHIHKLMNWNPDIEVRTVIGFSSRSGQSTIPQGATVWIDDYSWAMKSATGIVKFRDILAEVAVRSRAYQSGVGADIRFVCLG